MISKVSNPKHVNDYRSISLCNVPYKIITKMLTNRLKHILPSLISLTQCAFVLGRLIPDNILATYETLHTIHTQISCPKGYMAVKLDMNKTFDRVK